VLVLALDTATPASTAALVEVTSDGLAGVAERRTVDARAHGEKLAPEIAATLAEAGVRPADLAAIVAGIGPGPFTGLRVGLATAVSMGHALGIPTYGVCSLDGLGRAAGPGRVLVATDARRREIYFATYADGIRADGPDVDKPAEVAARLAGGFDRVAGEGGLKYGDLFGVPVEEHLLYPPGAALVALAAQRIREAAPSEPLTPLYLRRPDAVEPTARKAVLP